MKQQTIIKHHVFPNGLVLVAQSMPWLQSAAFTMALPAGCRHDPSDKLGLASFTSELAFRGGGRFDSRQLIETLEGFGCDYYSSAGIYHTFFGGAMPAENLLGVMQVYAEVLHKPHFPEPQLEDVRNVCLQELQGLEDDLAGKTMLRLRLRHYGHPYGRNPDGEIDSVKSIQLPDVKSFYRKYYQPHHAIIAVAGNLDWDALLSSTNKMFADWKPDPIPEPPCLPPERGYYHVPFESNQTHIALAWPGLSYRDPNYYVGRGTIGILSDGMSSRLFREVRERRGLCYTVSASCHSLHDRGAVFCYSGTTAESAQETLDVILEQIELLGQGVGEAELSRFKVQMRSGLIMQQESCRSRVSSIVGDMFHLGRVRTLDEVNECINNLTVLQLDKYLQETPLGPFDIVTLGQRPLEIRGGIPTTTT